MKFCIGSRGTREHQAVESWARDQAQGEGWGNIEDDGGDLTLHKYTGPLLVKLKTLLTFFWLYKLSVSKLFHE